MPNQLTLDYLINLREELRNSPDINTVLNIYTELRQQGYEYAGWAQFILTKTWGSQWKILKKTLSIKIYI